MADNIKGLIDTLKKHRSDDQKGDAERLTKLKDIDAKLLEQSTITKAMLDKQADAYALQSDALKDAKRKARLAVDSPAAPGAAAPDAGGASAAFARGEGDINNIIGIFGTGITGLLAAASAFGLAMAGLRGWETKAIASIRPALGTLGDIVGKGATSLRNSVLVRFFGFVEEGSVVRDAKTGRFAKAIPMTDQIAQAVGNLKANALRVFGLGVDGKPIVTQGADGRFQKVGGGAKFLASVGERVGSLLNPLRNAFTAIGDYTKGAGSALMKFLGGIGSSATGFLGIVGKILKPIGFIFSAYDGITAYMNSDKDGLIARLGDGIGAFLGDFIGAPFDLLKSGVSWIVKKLFGVEVNDDGTIPEGQGLPGWIVSKLNSFSFEETIGSIVSGLFGVVQKAVDWVKTLFTDPKEALSQLWTGLVGAGGLLDILWTPVSLAIDWVTKKFGWRDEDAPTFNLLEFLKISLTNAAFFIREKFLEVTDFFKSIPDRILFAAEEFWTNLSADIRIGLIELSDWFARLPAKLLAMIVNAVGTVSIEIPSWVPRYGGRVFSLMDQEEIDAANAAANAPNADSAARVAEIEGDRERALQGIEDRRATAERARMGELDALRTDLRRERDASIASITNNGGNTTNNTTNNYYTTTLPGGGGDPAAPGPR